MKAGNILLCFLISGASVAWGEPATQPSAEGVLREMDAAYSKLKSAQMDGSIHGHFDVAGKVTNESVLFTSSYAAPNQFRYESRDDVLMGSTGKKVFTFFQKREEYQMGDAPADKIQGSDWPGSIGRILQEQNLSLLLALSKSASGELDRLSGGHVVLLKATVGNGLADDTLQFEIPGANETATVQVDPSTHLVQQVTFDLRKALEKAGAVQVKKAEVVIDYSSTVADAALAANAFAWTQPAGALLISDTVAEASSDDDGLSSSLKAMVGKDAPDFSLKGLDDKAVKLSDLKGSVVIVDFWATWCGPCVAALPHLDQLYKDQSGNGLKVLAVDLAEEKDKVQAFVTKKGWGLPVVLDSDSAVAGLYKAEAIPETVVIGKDGKVKQIFVGGGNEEAIAALVAKEMK